MAFLWSSPVRNLLSIALWMTATFAGHAAAEQAQSVPGILTKPYPPFQFSEQPNCSPTKCTSPNGKDFAVISGRAQSVVIHMADGGVRSSKLPYDEVWQENWSRDGRWLIVLSGFNGPHRPLGEISYFDTFDHSFRSVDARGELFAGTIQGFALHPSRANLIIIRADREPQFTIFDLLGHSLRPFQ
jgi:hypothetical protein